MAKKKLKIEFNDEEGGNYTITLDGSMSRDKLLKIMDFVEILGDKDEQIDIKPISKDTSFGKLFYLIEKQFPLGSFSSADILEAYEDEYNEPIKLSTISTYLNRLDNKELLNRERSSSGWLYRRIRNKQMSK